MSMRFSPLWRNGFTLPTSDDLESQILLNRFRTKSRGKLTPRALTASRLQGWVVVGGILLGAGVFLGPWLIDEYREMLGYKFIPVAASTMPRMSVGWWENEWRKGNPLWRAGESTSGFYSAPFDFVRRVTGRDLYDASAFASATNAPPHAESTRWAWLRWWPFVSSSALTPQVPRVLLPLCGDSPIVREFAQRGFEVDAIDASETAMRACVARTECGLTAAAFPRVRLHWSDIFSPELWNGPLRHARFDVIYERQGLTSLNRDQRADYAFLLKRALAEDGVAYVEGTFRTGRVAGNARRGPPYALSKRDITELFPEREGFAVQCEETNEAMMKISRENRLLRRVPKELYVTPFHCVVFRKKVHAKDGEGENGTEGLSQANGA